MIAVQNKLEHIMTVVESKKEIEEALWIVINNKKTKLRIGVIYAPQESRTSKAQYKTMYESINDQILLAKQHEQKLLLLGDFNCKIGEHITGNTKEVTKSGRNFLKMVKNNKLTIVNTMEKCEGVWTRAEGQSKSVLDYMLVDAEEEQAVKKLLIDEKREFSPVGYSRNSRSQHQIIIR